MERFELTVPYNRYDPHLHHLSKHKKPKRVVEKIEESKSAKMEKEEPKVANEEGELTENKSDNETLKSKVLAEMKNSNLTIDEINEFQSIWRNFKHTTIFKNDDGESNKKPRVELEPKSLNKETKSVLSKKPAREKVDKTKRKAVTRKRKYSQLVLDDVKEALAKETMLKSDKEETVEEDPNKIKVDKDYFFVRSAEIGCKLCSFKGRSIVHHYRIKHPKSEVLISRLSPDVAEILIQDAVTNRKEYDKNHPRLKTKRRFKCPFCLRIFKDTRFAYFNHISRHTGEYRFRCDHCSYWANNGAKVRAHLNKMHYKNNISGCKMVYPDPRIAKYVFGHICSECNFVQMIRATVEEHAMLYHAERPEVHKVNLGLLFRKDTVDKNHNPEIPTEVKEPNVSDHLSPIEEFEKINVKMEDSKSDKTEVKDLSNLLVQMEELEEVNVKTELKKLDDSQLIDLDIKQEKVQMNNRELRNTSEGMEEMDQLKQLKKVPNVLEIGPISVIKESNLFTFHCKIQNCNYSSQDKKALAVHCESIHKDFCILSTEKCEVCLIKFEHNGKFITVHDIFLHIINAHKDFFESESGCKEEELSSEVRQLATSEELNSSSTNTVFPSLKEVIPPYNCKDDGFSNCLFKTLYFSEYLKHVEAIHQIYGLGSFSTEHGPLKEAIMEVWLAKEVGPFQCRYCKKATVTHQELESHQTMFHAQNQFWFYYRKFVPNNTVTNPEQVNLDHPSFINHVIHLPNQVHLCDFKLSSALFSMNSFKLRDGASDSLLPQSPLRDPDIESDELKVPLDKSDLLEELDPLHLDNVSPKDGSSPDEALSSKVTNKTLSKTTGRKLQCKWKGCYYQTYHAQTALIKHIKEKHVVAQSGKKFTCFWINCPRKLKPYTSKLNLSIHVRLHSGEKPHKCPFQGCNKTYSKIFNLKVHQKRYHTGERPYVCQFFNCSKRFANKYDMVRHQNRHNYTKAYVCQVIGCSRKYSDLYTLTEHMKNHTVEEQLEVKQKSIELKQKSVENKQKDDCAPKKTSCSPDSSKRQKVHYDTLQCKWEDCLQVHHSQTALVNHIETNHIRTQSGKKFTCFWDNCPRKSYTSKQNLSIHMRVHSGEKPNKCPVEGCNKAYSTLQNLKVHQRSHTGERPYMCQFSNCNKSFFKGSDRFRHQKSHYSTELFACHIAGCTKAYTLVTSLRKHVRKKHAVDEQLETKQILEKNEQEEDDFIIYDL